MKLNRSFIGFICVVLLAVLVTGISVSAKDSLPFTDVPDTWYTDSVATVYSEGIMKGVTSTTFE
ncbi:MAG: S-layer homology domain-containing protein, partial [Clostridia bacterium]|nr:S-layer homology domain-containing protein [Clostridia bacterium]